MIRRPPRSTPLYSSAASDVYKRQVVVIVHFVPASGGNCFGRRAGIPAGEIQADAGGTPRMGEAEPHPVRQRCRPPVSYTHLRAHETKANLVCRLLLEKKKKK